jgi:hypothetical protein
MTRIVPPEEARRLAAGLPLNLTVEKYNPNWAVYSSEWPETPVAKFSAREDADGFAAIPDLAYTAAVLGEQREAVLALHTGAGVRRVTPWSDTEERYCEPCNVSYPCPTARTLGVTE